MYMVRMQDGRNGMLQEVGVGDEEVLRCKRSNNCHNIVENATEHHLEFSLG